MKTTATVLTLACAFLLAGCNTFRGAGQDIQKAGSVIENAATRK